MCIVVAKYFKGTGWVAVKNRDQDYVPDIVFRDKPDKNVDEILVLYDKNTKYSEGMNNKELCIITTSLTPIIADETDAADGKKIDNALRCKTPQEAADYLIKNKLHGNIFIFNKEELILVEASADDTHEYEYVKRLVPKTEAVARTNHGIEISWAGFQYGVNEKQDFYRKSSETRLKLAQTYVKNSSTPKEMIDGLAKKLIKDLQLNSFRVATKPRQMRTVCQMMYVPSKHTMYIRPVQCNMTIETDKRHLKHELLDDTLKVIKPYDGAMKHHLKIIEKPDGTIKSTFEHKIIKSFTEYLNE